MNNIIVIMAGGLGKRMNSDLPKVLHKINGIPMIVNILMEVTQINSSKIYIIVGKYYEIIKKTISYYITNNNLQYIIQDQPLGTGHAIMSCRNELLKYDNYNVLILSGDVPLIKSNTMIKMLKNINKVRLMVTNIKNPFGYGRIIESNNIFEKIVEEKDCNNKEQNINKINCGIYSFNSNILCKYLPMLNNNNSQKEYYLTDIIEIIKNNENLNIELFEISEDKQIEILGINTPEQLLELELAVK